MCKQYSFFFLSSLLHILDTRILGRFATIFYFNCKHSKQSSKIRSSINLPSGHVMSHTKFGPDRFSRLDVYWIQTNRQTNKVYIDKERLTRVWTNKLLAFGLFGFCIVRYLTDFIVTKRGRSGTGFNELELGLETVQPRVLNRWLKICPWSTNLELVWKEFTIVELSVGSLATTNLKIIKFD